MSTDTIESLEGGSRHAASVRIGCVKYLNTLPLIEGLSAWRSAEVVSAVPSKLIGMLESGSVDVALASVVDAAREGVTALPVGMIGCDGPTMTVRVFSRVPLERVTTLAADTDSHTSVLLARVIFKHVYGREVSVVDYHARERAAVGGGKHEGTEEPETLLLIGDKVETDPPAEAEGYVHQLDLGEAWKGLTGLPFVYAVWMCRAGEERSAAVVSACEVLDRARRHNRTRLDWLVNARAQERGWDADRARRYLAELLRYEVGAAERQAVSTFLRMCKEMGLVERGGVRWADEAG